MAFDFACPDWFERLQSGRTPIADLPLDVKEAEKAVGIFDYLRLPDVPGQPTMESAAGDWLRDIVRAIFGSVDPKTGRRAVGEVFVLVPKKNSKTTSSAAIALTFMLLNKRPKADMLIVAPTQKIADTAFAQAKGMIEADPEDAETGRSYLQDRFHIREHKSMIECRVTGARLMIRTFDAKVLTGCKPVFCLIDETHELGKIPYAADVFRQIRGGMLPFPESLLMQITTQSDHEPAGVFKSELSYARCVRDGEITEGVKLLPVLYEFPVALQTDEGKSWLNPDLWCLVTPNLGRSITLDDMIESYQRASADGAHEIIGWATQHLNVEVGVALHGDRWAGALFWDAAAMPELTLAGIKEVCDVCVVGIDGGGLDDLMSMVVLGRHRKTRAWLAWGKAWAYPEVFERRKEIAPRLRDFEKDGDLVECKVVGDDAREIASIILDLHEAGLLPDKAGVGIDNYGGAMVLVDTLIEMGVPEEALLAVGQGYKQQPAVQTLPRKLKDKTMRHCGQKLMSWAVGNAKTELKGSNYVVTKQAAGAAKIDPLMALFDAAMLMLGNPTARGISVYRERGALVL